MLHLNIKKLISFDCYFAILKDTSSLLFQISFLHCRPKEKTVFFIELRYMCIASELPLNTTGLRALKKILYLHFVQTVKHILSLRCHVTLAQTPTQSVAAALLVIQNSPAYGEMPIYEHVCSDIMKTILQTHFQLNTSFISKYIQTCLSNGLVNL